MKLLRLTVDLSNMEITEDLDKIGLSGIEWAKPDWNCLAVPQNVKQSNNSAITCLGMCWR